MSRYLDTRDLYKRQQELQGFKDAVENARDELDQLSVQKPAEDESTLTELEEWETAMGDAQAALDDAIAEYGEEEQAELEELDELESEVSEWMHGETMIPLDDFEDYAREFADDIGAIPDENRWPCTCIDWERAARELAMDYSTVTFQGTDYYIRN